MYKIILSIILLFQLALYDFEIFKAYATAYFTMPFYYTQTTIIEYEDGELGTIVIQAIPINLWIIKNDTEQGRLEIRAWDMDIGNYHQEDN